MKKFIQAYRRFKENTYISRGIFGNLNFSWTSLGWLNLWDDEVETLSHLKAQPIAVKIKGK